MMPHVLDANSPTPLIDDDAEGVITEELGLPENVSTALSSTSRREPVLTGHSYNDLVAKFEMWMGITAPDPHVQNLMLSEIDSVGNKWVEYQRNMTEQPRDLEGQYVSLLPPVDRRKKAKRLRSACEGTRRRKVTPEKATMSLEFSLL